VEKRKISHPCQELNPDSRVIQPITYSLQLLSYPDQYGLRKTTRDPGQAVLWTKIRMKDPLNIRHEY
jgi:hypothetical protein